MLNANPYSTARLNVLITEDRPQAPEYWTSQLPRLLEPQGVAAYVARSGREAVVVAEQVRIHAAIIDLATPIGDGGVPWNGGGVSTGSAAGIWLLELFRRLPDRPPVVVVRSPSYSHRQFDRVMHDALRLGAFSVLNKPVDLEQILAVFRCVIDRRYQGHWPCS